MATISLKTIEQNDNVGMFSICFDLKEVAERNLKTLPYDERVADSRKHGTTFEITNPTHNAPTQARLQMIQDNISGIYREFLRKNEVDIYQYSVN